jgi:MoxR-like ATPase
MKASVVFRALKTVVVMDKQPVFIWGSPGIGKSAVVHQLAAELGIPLKDIRALLLDPVNLRGLPFVGKDGRSTWATPDFLPRRAKASCFWMN